MLLPGTVLRGEQKDLSRGLRERRNTPPSNLVWLSAIFARSIADDRTDDLNNYSSRFDLHIAHQPVLCLALHDFVEHTNPIQHSTRLHRLAIENLPVGDLFHDEFGGFVCDPAEIDKRRGMAQGEEPCLDILQALTHII